MPRLPTSAVGTSTAGRVMGHRPELLQAWENLKDAFLGSSATLSPHLKDEVRRTLAQRTGCQFCASLGQPAGTHADRQESLAVAFADRSPATTRSSVTPRCSSCSKSSPSLRLSSC